MTSDLVISFSDVTFSYNGDPILEDVNWQAEPRDFTCVVGPNGGGKTTLLKLVLGLCEPQKGSIRIFGKPPARVRDKIGYVPQHTSHDPLFPVTAFDVTLMGSRGRGWAGSYNQTDHRDAMSALADVELEDKADMLYANLSGGQRQRVLIARAMCGQPDLLLLDEALANTDAKSSAHILQLLQKLNQRITILMVSHNFNIVPKGVNNVLCINKTVMKHATCDLAGEHIHELDQFGMCMVRHDHKAMKRESNDD